MSGQLQPGDDSQSADVWEFLGRQQVRAWFCPVRAHRTVEWRDDVAHCTHGTCELTSEDTRPWLRDMAEAIAKAETERDEARTELENLRSQSSANFAAAARTVERRTAQRDAARGEVENLRQMLAAFVVGRHCRAPKWGNQVGGLVACRECRTCEAALAGGLVDFGTGWTTP